MPFSYFRTDKLLMNIMNKIILSTIALVTTLLMTSCLTANLPKIDTYKGANIESVNAVFHRYYTDKKIPASGERQVKQHQLSVPGKAVQKDETAGTISFEVKIPTNLPADQKGKVKADNLVVVLNISTAALIEPIDGAPMLGVPGDWSKTNKYKVTAASGETKEWSVTLHLVQ